MSMKSEMTVLAGEITVLRTCVLNGSSDDDALRATCTQLALENEGFVSRMWDIERQLVLARRGEADMEASLRITSRDKAQYILKSEHKSMLNQREEDLAADMRKELSNCYSDMRQKTSEAVETARAES